MPHPQPSKDPKTTLTRHFTEELPEASQDEIVMALRQLQNGGASKDNGITIEMLKTGGKPILVRLQRIFNSVLFTERTPKPWNNRVVVMFYRPISLLSHVYKEESSPIASRVDLTNFSSPKQWHHRPHLHSAADFKEERRVPAPVRSVSHSG